MAENDVYKNDYKAGLTWISDRTGQLRYAFPSEGDEPTSEKWLQPLSAYFAGETIKRGQPVSIATKEDYAYVPGLSAMASDPHTYLVLTCTAWHDRTLGIALEYAEAGQPVHVLPIGKVIYDRSKLPDREYDPGFSFNADIGKSVYVRGGLQLDANDEPILVNGETQYIRGELTTNPIESYSAYSKVVHVGFVTDAPTGQAENYSVLEIQTDGDSRGVIDYSVIEGVFGEKARFSKADPVRAFAIGCEDDAAFTVDLLFTAPSHETSVPEDAFFGLTRMDGKSAFITMDSAVKPSTGSVQDYADEAFINLAEHYAGTFQDPSSAVKIIPLGIASLNQERVNVDAFMARFRQALDQALAFVSDGEVTSHVVKSSEYLLNNESVVTGIHAILAANAIGGYYDLHVSKSLATFFGKTWEPSHGSYYNRGRAVFADIRVPERQNVFGVYFSADYGKDYVIGDRALFLRSGLFRANSDTFAPGTEYFLGFNGRIRPLGTPEYFNSQVKIGSATTKRNLIVDCGELMKMADGDVPVGYMKPSVNSAAEYGFVLCDGITKLTLNESNQDFFDRLQGYFPPDDMQITAETDGSTSFVVPKVVYENDKLAQIKYVKRGVYKDIPRIAIKRFFGEFSEAPTDDLSFTGLSLPSEIDVTDLVTWGPLEGGYKALDMETLDVKLYVANGPTNDGTEVDWQEIPAGYFTYNNTQQFGFRWKLNKQTASLAHPYGKYTLTAEIGDGYGIAFQNGTPQAPEPCYGKEYKLFVSRREVWDRQFDVEALFKNCVAQSLVDGGNEGVTSAVSGAAVIQFLKDHIEVDTIDNVTLNVGSTEEPGAINLTGTESIYGELKLFTPMKDLVMAFDPTSKKITYVASQKPTSFGANDLIPLSRLTAHEDSNITSENDVHGIKQGHAGNINAARLRGFRVGTSLITASHQTTDNGAFIPFVNDQRTLEIGNGIRFNYSENDVVNVLANVAVTGNSLRKTFESPAVAAAMSDYEVVEANVKNGVEQKVLTTHYTNQIQNVINTLVAITDTESPEYAAAETNLKALLPGYDPSRLNELTHDFIFMKGSNMARVAAASFDVASSIEYKNLITSGALHGPESDGKLNDFSALQAAYELPIYEFKYKNDSAAFKNYLGIITERTADARNIVPQYVDVTTQPDPQTPPDTVRIDNVENGTASTRDIFSDLHAPRTDRVYKYSYTPEQVAAIQEYLKLIVDTSGKAQSVQSSVGLLLKAAKETQERLLQVETSIGGTDAKTIPGERVKQFTTESINQDPTQLGLNRLVRALCKELFDQADPSNVSPEATYFETTQVYVNANPTMTFYVLVNGAYVQADDAALANHEVKKYTSSLNDIKLGRVDRLDAEVNGEQARASNGNQLIALNSAEGSTYPDTVHETAKDPRETTLEAEAADAFRIKQLTIDPDTFDPATGRTNDSFDGLNDAVNRICAKLDALTVSVYGKNNVDSRPQRMDTIRENIEHLIKEVYFDAADGDEETAYHDEDGAASKPYDKYISRVDLLAKKLYGFTLSYANDFQNFSAGPTNDLNGLRTFNGKTLKGADKVKDDQNVEAKTEFTPDDMTCKKDYDTYASFLDVLVDTLGKDLLPRHNFNKHDAPYQDYPDRAMKTVSDRIDTIERSLDVLSRMLDRTRDFENGILPDDDMDKELGFVTGHALNGATKKTELYVDGDGNSRSHNRNISSLKEFCLRLSKWTGLAYTADNSETVDGNRVLLEDSPFHDSTAKNLKAKTNVHDVLSDIYSRLRAEENETEFAYKRLGPIYNRDAPKSFVEEAYVLASVEDLTDASVIKYIRTGTAGSYGYTPQAQAAIDLLGTYWVKDGNITVTSTYTVSSDVNALLKTIFGKMSDTAQSTYDHFDNASISEDMEEFDVSDNIISNIIKLSYATPKRIQVMTPNPSGITPIEDAAVNYDVPSKDAIWYDIDGSEIVVNNPNNEVEAFPISAGHRATLFADFLETTERPSRFKIIENSVRAIRKFIGMDQLTTFESRYGGAFAAEALPGEDQLFAIANFNRSTDGAFHNLMDMISSVEALRDFRTELGSKQSFADLPGVPATYSADDEPNTETDASTVYGHLKNIEEWINANDSDSQQSKLEDLERKEINLTANLASVAGFKGVNAIDETRAISTGDNYIPTFTHEETDESTRVEKLTGYTGLDGLTDVDLDTRNLIPALVGTPPTGWSNPALSLRIKALGAKIADVDDKSFKKENVLAATAKVTEEITGKTYDVASANAIFQDAKQVEDAIDARTYDDNITTYAEPTTPEAPLGTLTIDLKNKGDATVVKLANYQQDLKNVKDKIDAVGSVLSDAIDQAESDAVAAAKTHAEGLISADQLTALSDDRFSFTVEPAKDAKLAQDIDQAILDLGVIRDCIAANREDLKDSIGKRASGATQTVTDNLREIIKDLVKTQATYFGPNNTSAPVVHATKAAGSINIPAYHGGNGEIAEPSDGSPQLDVLKKSIPSTYDVVAMMVSMYHAMLDHTHALDGDKTAAPSGLASLFTTAAMGSEVTTQDQSDNKVDNTTLN